MKIKLSKPLAISSHDIDDFIQETGVDLPEEFAKFLLEYNGARPETNIFSIRATGTAILINNFMRPLLRQLHKNQKCPVTA